MRIKSAKPAAKTAKLKKPNDSLIFHQLYQESENSADNADNSEATDEVAAIIQASLGGLARSLPTGIRPESANVATRCFKPPLVNLLTAIHKKYRRPVIITSGYRSPVRNVKAGGVRGSLHLACSAADIKVRGVSKFQLASFVRSLPNRGGVGVYCHNAVHIDTGAPRQWHKCAARRRLSRSAPR